MLHKCATVHRNTKKSNDIFLLEFYAPEIVLAVMPGQFVHLLIPGESYDPLLRRPFSICYAKDGMVRILYRVVGRGTKALSQIKPGTGIDVLGPLGRGFQIPETGESVLLGGGMGAAPLIYLAWVLHEKNLQYRFLLGMAENELDFLSQLLPVATRIDISQEKGEEPGDSRLVTELLPPLLGRPGLKNIFCCGPEPMYKEVAHMLQPFKEINVQVSMERKMACGVGTCLACVLPVHIPGRKRAQYLRTCVEGPVFRLEEVMFDGT